MCSLPYPSHACMCRIASLASMIWTTSYSDKYHLKQLPIANHSPICSLLCCYYIAAAKTWNGIRLNNTLIPSSGKPYVIQAAQTAQPTFVQCAAAGVPNSELVVKLFVNSVLTYNTRKPCGTGPVCRAEAASTVMLKAGDTLECKATRTVSMGQNGEKAKEESHLVVQVEGK
eukprot:scpid82599/ scgid2182/ 